MNVAENYQKWSHYNWRHGGAEWSKPWGSTYGQWLYTLYPRIAWHLPCKRILEIGCGAGRWSRYLTGFAKEELLLVDLVPEAIAACMRNLPEADNVEYVANDGMTLHMVDSDSVGFAFSFDSLVHAELDVLQSYLAELRLKLRHGGRAFLHHSNSAEATQHDPDTHDHQRAYSVGQKLVAQAAVEQGLGVISQEIISWGKCSDIDCLTTVVRGHNPAPRVYHTLLAPEQELSRRWTEHHQPPKETVS